MKYEGQFVGLVYWADWMLLTKMAISSWHSSTRTFVIRHSLSGVRYSTPLRKDSQGLNLAANCSKAAAPPTSPPHSRGLSRHQSACRRRWVNSPTTVPAIAPSQLQVDSCAGQDPGLDLCLACQPQSIWSLHAKNRDHSRWLPATWRNSR